MRASLPSLVALAFTTAVLVSTTAYAVDVFPVPYTGQLSIGGSPVNGRHFFGFALYNVASGGVPIYTQAESLSVANGVYSTQLNTPFTAWGEKRWIGVAVDGGSELLPRVPVGAVPYSIISAYSMDGVHAVNADTANVARSPNVPGLTWRTGPAMTTLTSMSSTLIDSITIVCPGPGAVMLIATGVVYPGSSTSGARLTFQGGVLYWDCVGTVPDAIPYTCTQAFPVYAAGPQHFDLMGTSASTSFPGIARQSFNALYFPKIY